MDQSNQKVQWIVIRSKPKQERLAARQVRDRLGIRVFSPSIRYSKMTRRGKVRFNEALFPGYIFCCCDLVEDLRHLLAVQGVQGVVRYGEVIPAVPDAFVEELMAQIPSDSLEVPDPEIEIGQEVRIIEGPLKDLRAVVTQVLTPGQRVKILLDFLGREAEVAVSVSGLIAEDFDPKGALHRANVR